MIRGDHRRGWQASPVLIAHHRFRGRPLVAREDAASRSGSGGTLVGALLGGVVACSLSVGACSPAGGEDNSGTPEERAARRYLHSCAPCHGESGAGNGAIAATMSPTPRDFRDRQWQASVTDEHLRAVIGDGGLKTGKSAAMPADAELKADPELMNALIAKLRAFERP